MRSVLLSSLLFVLTLGANDLGGLEAWNALPRDNALPPYLDRPPLTGACSPSRPRTWSVADLEPAFEPPHGHLGYGFHAQRLLDKLHAGQPIVAMGLGSSFVERFAGCFQASLQALLDLDIIPNPVIYPFKRHEPPASTGTDGSAAPGPDSSPPPEEDGIRCEHHNTGYMAAFMDTLNRTWPHAGHVFVNGGKGSVNLNYFTDGACTQSSMPQAPDLVVLDTVSIGANEWFTKPVAAAEILLRRFLQAPSQPLVLLLSNTRTCASDVDHGRLSMTCRMCLDRQQEAECQAVGPEPYTEPMSSELHQLRMPYETLALHYRVPHISIHRAVQALVGSQVPGQVNLSRWQFLSSLYHDEVHPRPPQHAAENTTLCGGTLLIADLLVYALQKWQEQGQGRQQGQAAPDTYVLPPALHEEATRLYHSRCWTVGVPQAHMESVRSRATRINGTEEDKYELQEVSNYMLGFGATPPLHVMGSEGFTLQAFYKGARGTIVVKPGWLASTAGAWLEFDINTDFGGPSTAAGSAAGLRHGGKPLSPATVLISYITSYDGWGRALISCVSGCACEALEVDAHRSETQHSFLVDATLEVTRAPVCRLRVEVLSASSSGGHRFKLSRVVARVPLPT